MKTIDAIYENGVFRPLEPVDLPDRARVKIQHEDDAERAERRARNMKKIYEVLSRRYDTGDENISDRHNEHQP